MKLPKSFKVGHKKYSVHEYPTLDDCNQGVVYYERREVHIARRGLFTRYTPKQKHEVLIHEMVHAVLHDMGSKYNREEFVEPFAAKLSAAILSARF